MSVSETGHAKNIANFNQLIAFCAGYGAAYNPSRPALTLQGLQQLSHTAHQHLQQFHAANTAHINAINERQLIFRPLRVISTRVVGALAASGAGPFIVADAQTINRKLQGKSLRPKKEDAVEPPVTAGENIITTISTSQQSFDSLIDHFARLITLVSQEPAYSPNEADLQVTGLLTRLQQLQTANTKVIEAFTALSNSRILRGHTLYQPVTGLVPVALSVRQYIKSLYGFACPQYKQVRDVHIRKLRF